ncbi:MAG: TRAP transporter small permease subunit [Dehalococcoidia bacterium]|nr:TRAP transporter small permease subunit [Dehalococcoidia bacterium]
MKIFIALGRIIDKTNTWIAKAMAFLILPILALTLYGVIMRYVLHQPTVWGWQVLLLLFIPVATVSGGYVLSVNSHIRLDLLYGRWSDRGKAISDVATFVVFLFFTTMLAIATIKMAWDSAAIKETYGNYPFHGPIYPKKIALAIGVVLLLVQGIVNFVRNIHIIREGKKASREH